MAGRPLRPGMDRHQVGEQVANLLLDDEDVPVGLTASGPIGEALQADRVVDHRLDDPFGNDRRITGKATYRFDGSLEQAGLHFRSKDKMDIDAAYAVLRKRMRKHGTPKREVTGHLTFIWEVGGGRAFLSRYKDGDDMAVLQLSIHGPPSRRGVP